MPKLIVRRYEPSDGPAIDRLNERLRAGGVEYDVYGENGQRSGESEPRPLKERFFVAAEGEEIRGGIWLREHQFSLNGSDIEAGWAKYPVSESLIDGAYRGVPAALVLKLMREQPNLMTLGLGGHEGAFARLVAGMGWKGDSVPFLVRIVRPAKVLRELPVFRSTKSRRLVANALASSGLAWLAHQSVSRAWRLVSRVGRGYHAETISTFGSWVDDLWNQTRTRYGLSACRNQRMLEWLYPEEFPHMMRFRVEHNGDLVGWIAVIAVDMSRSRRSRAFGDLKVGLLADAFAAPEHAVGVLAAGVDALASSGVDLIFTNQFHPAWIRAVKRLQFFPGPTNFAFYRAPKMEARLKDPEVQRLGIFVNRGDCDGPRFW